MRSFATLFLPCFLAPPILFLLTACGGGSPPSPSPPQVSDFSVSVSPVSASAVLGNIHFAGHSFRRLKERIQQTGEH